MMPSCEMKVKCLIMNAKLHRCLNDDIFKFETDWDNVKPD